MTNVTNERVINAVKQWLTPGLISLLGMMLWNQLSELKSDVKVLLVNQGITESKILYLEKEIEYIRNNKYLLSDNKIESDFRSPNLNLTSKAIPKKEDEPEIPKPESKDNLRKKSN